MSISNIDQVIEILVEKTTHSRDEIKKMIADIEKDNELVDAEGAAYILAHDLGVVIDYGSPTEELKIKDLSAGLSNLTLTGRVSRIYSTREFERKDKTMGKVRNIEIVDDTGNIRVALWDTRADEIEEKNIMVGSVVRISGANAKTGYKDNVELSIGNSSLIDPVKNAEESEYPEVERAEIVSIQTLEQKEEGTEVSLQGKVIDHRGEGSTFTRKDGSGEGQVTSFRISDGTGSCRITFWNAHVELANQFKIGDDVAIRNVAVRNSEYGKEATYRDYSSIEKLEGDQFADVETGSVAQGQELDKLVDVKDGARNLTVTGMIVDLGRINEFERDGTMNQVSNMTIQDKTAMRRVTLWRDKASLVNELGIKTVIKITNASAKYSTFSNEVELSVNDYSTVTVLEENTDDYEMEMELIQLRSLTETRRKVAVKLQIARFFDMNTIDRDDGSQAKVLNVEVFDLHDGTKGRLAAWDDQIPKIENLQELESVILKDVTVKPSGDYPPSIVINEGTEIESLGFDEAITFQTASTFQTTNYDKTGLDKLIPESRVEVRGQIVKAYPPNVYPACTECRKRVKVEGDSETGTCTDHGDVMYNLNMILKLTLDDHKETAIVTAFTDIAETLLQMSAKDAKDMIDRLGEPSSPIDKSGIEFKEVIVQGKVVEENYSGDTQVSIRAHSINFVDFAQENDEWLNKQ